MSKVATKTVQGVGRMKGTIHPSSLNDLHLDFFERKRRELQRQQNVVLYTNRLEKGLDIWTGEKLPKT